MKDKILQLINNNLAIPLCSDKCTARFEGINELVDELTALMSYREVRQIVLHRTVHDGTNLQAIIIESLLPYYSEQTILQAIEQVKNEMK